MCNISLYRLGRVVDFTYCGYPIPTHFCPQYYSHVMFIHKITCFLALQMELEVIKPDMAWVLHTNYWIGVRQSL